jgi:hypothetical protein
MNQLFSKTKFIKNNTSFEFNLKDIKDMSFKKDELFFVKNGDLNKEDEIVHNSKNIFTVYSDSSYCLYRSISDALKEACSLYEINKDMQNYMIYGKVSKYGDHNKGIWYDFPGINIPYLHGFFFFDGTFDVSFKNQNSIIKETIDKNTIIVNKPTDLINIKAEKESDVVEFYIVPNKMLKYNEPGVWVPIL